VNADPSVFVNHAESVTHITKGQAGAIKMGVFRMQDDVINSFKITVKQDCIVAHASSGDFSPLINVI
jgi:hypothetical protein